jgi:hypothetical protein
MEARNETAQLGRYILSRLGEAWRDGIGNIRQSEQPHRMRCVLDELKRLEAKAQGQSPASARGSGDPRERRVGTNASEDG